MNKQWMMTVARVVSAGAVLALAPACGTVDDQAATVDPPESISNNITVTSRSQTRLMPASAAVALGTYPSDTGGNFEVYTASDGAQTKFVIQFANLQSAPVNVCGAFTCNGAKTSFLTTVGPSLSISVVQAVANGRRCLAGDKFRLAYTASTSTIPQATCDTTKARI